LEGEVLEGEVLEGEVSGGEVSGDVGGDAELRVTGNVNRRTAVPDAVRISSIRIRDRCVAVAASTRSDRPARECQEAICSRRPERWMSTST
jgi:hypothetical protein